MFCSSSGKKKFPFKRNIQIMTCYLYTILYVCALDKVDLCLFPKKRLANFFSEFT